MRKTLIIHRRANREISRSPTPSKDSANSSKSSIKSKGLSQDSKSIVDQFYSEVWKRAKFKLRAFMVFKRIYEHLKLYGVSSSHVILPYCEPGLDKHLSRRATKIMDSNADEPDKIRTPFAVVNPYGRFKKYWNCVVVGLLIYTAIITPFFLSYSDSLNANDIFWVENAVTLLFFIDFCISCSCAYENSEGVLVTSRLKILLHYLRGWMIIDFISFFPVDYIVSTGNTSSRALARFARIPKLYRLVRISRLLKLFNSHFNESVLEKLQDLLSLKSSGLRLAKSCLTILACVHIFSCFWYLTAKIYDFTPDTWVVRLGYIDSDIATLYIASLYWAIATISTVGYGDITGHTQLEKVLCMLWMATGLYFFSFTIGSLNSMMSSFDLKENALSSKLAAIDEFASESNLSKDLRNRLKHSLKYAAEKRGFSWHDKMNLIYELPKNLRYEIAMNMHQGAARCLNFFTNKDYSLVALIVPLLEASFIEKDNWVYNINDFADEIYFLVKGNIRILADQHIVIKSIQKGCYFGDIEVFSRISRRYAAFSTRFSEVLIMNKNTIYQIRDNFITVYQEMLETALCRETNYEKTIIEIKEMEKFYSGKPLTKRMIDMYKLRVEVLLKQRMNQLRPKSEVLSVSQMLKKLDELLKIASNKIPLDRYGFLIDLQSRDDVQ